MALRSFSNVKLLSAFVVDEISFALKRRGYAAASQGVVSNAARGRGATRSNVMGNKQAEESGASSPWVPDPKTGFYRPENQADEVDVVELRNMLLKPKIKPQ